MGVFKDRLKNPGKNEFTVDEGLKKTSGPVGISVGAGLARHRFEPEFEAIAEPSRRGLAHRRPQ